MAKYRGKVIQEHHLEAKRTKGSGGKVISDLKSEAVLLYKGEHWAITQLQRRKNISQGFIKALKFWINQVEESAIPLTRK